MSWRAPLTIVLLLAVASVAAAGSVPKVYFMKDTDQGPAAPGWLDWVPPDPADLANPQNNTPPSARMVTALKAEQFVRLDGANNTGRIRGPVIIGLWAPETPLVDEATLVVQFGVYQPGATPLAMDGEPLATARIPIEGGNITPPDPTAFVPGDPTDPEAAAAHIAAAAQAYALPMLLQPPYVILLLDDQGSPILDFTVDPEARVGVTFQLESPEGALLPVPLAVGQPMEYDFGLSPSFLYVPWYEPDPPRTATKAPTSPTKTVTPTRSTLGGGSATGGADGGGGGDKGIPLPGLLVPAALAAGVLAARRRLDR